MTTVLLLQPDPELTDVWRVALESSGHAVVTAASAGATADHMRDGGIDVVVADSGDRELDLLVDSMERLPDCPPLVLISASPNAPETSVRIGAAAFLPKPCSPGDLDEVVSRVSGSTPATELSDEPTMPRRIPRS